MAKRLPDKLFRQIYAQVPRLCVDVVIKDKRGIVLAFRQINPWKNYWHLPGGTVLFGESLAQAAKRIVMQETGLRVKVINPLGYIEFLEEIKMAGRHSVSVALLARPTSGKLRGSWQGENIKFFKKLPKPIVPKHLRLLKTI